MKIREASVEIPAPVNPSAGSPHTPYIKREFPIIFNRFADNMIHMEVFVSVMPSANCLKLLNIMTNTREVNCNRK